MRAEAHSFFLYFAQFAQAEYLESAGIGKQRSIPAHELVQPAEFAHQLMSRTKIKMIGVPQNDLRAEISRSKVFQNVLGDRFDRACCAHRHEGRCFYRPVGAMDARLTGGTGLGLDCEGQSHNLLWYRLSLNSERSEECVLFRTRRKSFCVLTLKSFEQV